MGITIEQYRARIGTYCNCVKTKDISRFESIYWNRKTIVYLLLKVYIYWAVLYMLLCC